MTGGILHKGGTGVSPVKLSATERAAVGPALRRYNAQSVVLQGMAARVPKRYGPCVESSGGMLRWLK